MQLAEINDLVRSGALSCIAAVTIGIWVFSLISWTIMGDVDPLLGLLGIGTAFGMLYAVNTAPTVLFGWLSIVALVGTVIVFPVMRRHINKRRFAQMDVDQIEAAYRMLSAKPDNAAAKYRMAEGLYARGYLWQAVAIAEDALNHLPERGFEGERKAVGAWRRAAEARKGVSMLPCLQCGHVNQPAAVYCSKCRSSYLADYARGRWMGRTLGRKLLAAWICGLVVFVGIPYAVSSQQISDAGRTALIAGEVVLCVLVAVRAFAKGADS